MMYNSYVLEASAYQGSCRTNEIEQSYREKTLPTVVVLVNHQSARGGSTIGVRPRAAFQHTVRMALVVSSPRDWTVGHQS